MSERFITTDPETLWSEFFQYMSDQGYWSREIESEAGQVISKLLCEIAGRVNYFANRTYEETFEESARRFDTLVNFLQRHGFNFEKFLQFNARQFTINRVLWGGYELTGATDYTFSENPNTDPDYNASWEVNLTLTLSGVIRLRHKFTDDGKVEGYFKFYPTKKLYSANNDPAVFQVPLTMNVGITITRILGFAAPLISMSVTNWESGSTTASTQYDIVSNHVFRTLLQTLQSVVLTSTNFNQLFSNLNKVYYIRRVSDSTEFELYANQYQSTDSTKTFLSYNGDEEQVMIVFEGFNVNDTMELSILNSVEFSGLLNTEDFKVLLDDTDLSSTELPLEFITEILNAGTITLNSITGQATYIPTGNIKLLQASDFEIISSDITRLSDTLWSFNLQPNISPVNLPFTFRMKLNDLPAPGTVYDAGDVDFTNLCNSQTGATDSSYMLLKLLTDDADVTFGTINIGFERKIFQPNLSTVDLLRNYMRDKKVENNALVTRNDFRYHLQNIPEVYESNAYEESDVIKVTFYPYTQAVIDAVNEFFVDNSFVDYTILAPRELGLCYIGNVYHTSSGDISDLFNAALENLNYFFDQTLTLDTLKSQIATEVEEIITLNGTFRFMISTNETYAPTVAFSDTISRNLKKFTLVFPALGYHQVELSDASGTYQDAYVSISYTIDKPNGVISFTLSFLGSTSRIYVLPVCDNYSLILNNREYMKGSSVLTTGIVNFVND